MDRSHQFFTKAAYVRYRAWMDGVIPPIPTLSEQVTPLPEEINEQDFYEWIDEQPVWACLGHPLSYEESVPAMYLRARLGQHVSLNTQTFFLYEETVIQKTPPWLAKVFCLSCDIPLSWLHFSVERHQNYCITKRAFLKIRDETGPTWEPAF